MNLLNIIYIIGALAIGLLIGMILELALDAQTIRELQDDNRRLRKLNIHLEKQSKSEVIEIIDKRTPETNFSFPNKEGF